MAPRLFLAPGSGVAVEIERPRIQPARGVRQVNRQPQLVIQESRVEALDLTTEEGQFHLGLWAGNQIAAAVNGR